MEKALAHSLKEEDLDLSEDEVGRNLQVATLTLTFRKSIFEVSFSCLSKTQVAFFFLNVMMCLTKAYLL
jgi:hypothetical protein